MSTKAPKTAKKETRKFLGSYIVRPPVMRPQGRDKDAQERNRKGDARRKKIPACLGVEASTSGGGTVERVLERLQMSFY